MLDENIGRSNSSFIILLLANIPVRCYGLIFVDIEVNPFDLSVLVIYIHGTPPNYLHQFELLLECKSSLQEEIGKVQCTHK